MVHERGALPKLLVQLLKSLDYGRSAGMSQLRFAHSCKGLAACKPFPEPEEAISLLMRCLPSTNDLPHTLRTLQQQTSDSSPFTSMAAGNTLRSLGAIVLHLRLAKLDCSLHNVRFLQWMADAGSAGPLRSAAMRLDASALQCLNVLRPSPEDRPVDGTAGDGSLLGFLDTCVTGDGRAMLRKWLCAPLTSLARIAARLNGCEKLSMLSVEHQRILQSGLRRSGRGSLRKQVAAVQVGMQAFTTLTFTMPLQYALGIFA